MLDRDPAPEGFEERCVHCGRLLMGEAVKKHIYNFPDQDTIPARFCSEECAEAYRDLMDEEYWEETEEIDRAGAT
jgi:hypothetical protein